MDRVQCAHCGGTMKRIGDEGEIFVLQRCRRGTWMAEDDHHVSEPMSVMLGGVFGGNTIEGLPVVVLECEECGAYTFLRPRFKKMESVDGR